jgi:DNA-binding NtrC family response regulator
MTAKNLLLIEDDLILGESLVQRFELEGIKVVWVRRLAEAQLHIDTAWGAIISDVRLPDGMATDWYAQLPAPCRLQQWYFLTGYGSVNDAVAALQAGAREYLTKPFDTEKLVSAVMQTLFAHLEPNSTVLGVSSAMRHIESLVYKLSKQKTSVLVNGESGVGKEVVAQMIHNLDIRS